MEHVPLAYDVDAVRSMFAQGRSDLLAEAGANPVEDVRAALLTARAHLKARKIKHFAHEGVVTDSREDDDHEAQLRAVDTLLNVYGAYAPRSQPSSQAAGVEVVIDPSSGQVIVRAVAR